MNRDTERHGYCVNISWEYRDQRQDLNLSAQFVAPLLQQTHSLRLLNTTKVKTISKSIIKVKASPILIWERGYTAYCQWMFHHRWWTGSLCHLKDQNASKVHWGYSLLSEIARDSSGRLLSSLQHWDAPLLTPKLGHANSSWRTRHPRGQILWLIVIDNAYQGSPQTLLKGRL